MDEAVQLNTTLAGRYEIERQVGAGGMATVYLARDIRHGRNVALKVLRPDLGAVLGVERFLGEIRVTANLQHPNLLPLFDSGEAAGLLFYVMPYIEGETLRARLEREKQLPVDEAVRIAVAIAGALDYAHRHGVIHRDLKPENILLPEGQPIVADFGIALAVSNAGAGRITQTGLSLGTPHYMSPEQATGDRAIDGRTDIYSLGAMTYEMLTGDPPHTGGTSQAVIARVLTEKPRSIRATRPAVPPHVEAAIDQSLEKLPADRFASAREFSEALTGARPVSTASYTRARELEPRGRWSRMTVLPWVLAAIATVAAVALALRPKPAPPPLVRFGLQLPDSTSLYAGGGWKEALSRDGKQLAIVTTGVRANSPRIYVRRIDDLEAQPVNGTEGASSPSFSPDGKSLLFESGGALKTVPVNGGTVRGLAESAGGSSHWGDGNQILYSRSGAIWVTTPDGGTQRQVSRAGQYQRVALPHVLPGGTHALVTVWKSSSLDDAMLGVMSIADGSIRELGFHGTSPRYASGFLLFGTKDADLFAVPFSLDELATTGEPALVARGVWQGSGGATGYTVADNGTLVYHTGVGPGDGGWSMVRVDQKGNEVALRAPQRPYAQPRVSPDGRRVAVRVGVSEYAGTVWIYDITSGTSVPLSPDSGSIRGEWTRDGSRVLFLKQTADSQFVLSRRWDLSEPAQVIARGGPYAFHHISVGNPGGLTAIRRGSSAVGAKTDIFLAPTESLMAARPFMMQVADINNALVSPDGRLLAFASDESGIREIYVTPIPGPGPRVPVSAGGGVEPMWSRDGKHLFYRGVRVMIKATIVQRPELAVERRDTLFEDRYGRYAGYTNYDVFPDGSFLLLRTLRRDNGLPASLVAVLNWQQLLSETTGRR